jgi:hypothetical protein
MEKNTLSNSILSTLPFLKSIKNSFLKILNTVPRILRKNDKNIVKYIYDVESIIASLIIIIVLDNYENINLNVIRDDKLLINDVKPIKAGILSLKSIESIIYVSSIILIFLNIIHITYLHLYNPYDTHIFEMIYNIPLYIIVFLFSLVIFIIINTIDFIQNFLSNFIYTIIYLIDQLSELSNDKERSTSFIKYFLLYIVVFTIIILFLNINNKSDSLKKNTFTYAFFIIIPLIIVMYLSTPISSENSLSINILMAVMLALIFSTSIYYYLKLNKTTSLGVNYISSIIIIVFTILALANIFYILGNYLRSFTGMTGIIINFIFYIPCLVITFIKYFMNEFRMTTNPIYVILFLELIVILIYIYLPMLLSKMNKKNGTVLLPKSYFLNEKNVISNSTIHEHISPNTEDPNLYFSSVLNQQNTFTNWLNLNIQKFSNTSHDDLKDASVFNENYAISMWIYLNVQNISENNEIEIFNFGIDNHNEKNRKGKPRITYLIKKKNDEMIKIYFTNQTNPLGSHEFKITKQKWNNIVINFSNSKADLFVNGELEFTYNYLNNKPLHNAMDFVTTGEDNGLNGAICNINYYPKNLSLIEITNNYNILMFKNPPIY